MDPFGIMLIIGSVISVVQAILGTATREVRNKGLAAISELNSMKSKVEQSGQGNLSDIRRILDKYDIRSARIEEQLRNAESVERADKFMKEAKNDKKNMQAELDSAAKNRNYSNQKRVYDNYMSRKPITNDTLYSSSSITGKESKNER